VTGQFIDFFMWGFQQHFRFNVESAVTRALEEVGLQAKPTVFLVGLVKPGGAGHAICIEPEDGPLSPADFAALGQRALERFAADPETRILDSDSRLREQRQTWLHEKAYRDEIAAILEPVVGLRFVVAPPTLVNEHFVYTAIGLPGAVYDENPGLHATSGPDGRQYVTGSLIRGVLDELLGATYRALLAPDPGSDFGLGVAPAQIARAAGASLTDSAVVLSGNQFAHSLFDAINAVATTGYEKRVGVGRLIVAEPDSEHVRRDLILTEAVPVREIRTLRKLLETSRIHGAALLTDGSDAYGLGELQETYDPGTESAFEIVVTGHGNWDLRHSGTVLMSVENGVPHLPRQRVSRDRFNDIARRVFAPTGGCNLEALWALTEAAADAEHGTMIVVSSHASDEGARLRGQALNVDPSRVEADLVRQLTSIDGAVLVDTSAAVVAIGVILDGIATAAGDRSRGARYNSAVRYMASASAATVIILVSEDGMVNLLPDLRPQIRIADRDAMVVDLRTAAAIEPVNGERFYEAFNRVKVAAFYLTPEQCAEANALRDDHWERRRAAGAQIWLTEAPIVPDPAMSSEYLID
jgi:DisA bacterial checkpoint controller nucleotide-binding